MPGGRSQVGNVIKLISNTTSVHILIKSDRTSSAFVTKINLSDVFNSLCQTSWRIHHKPSSPHYCGTTNIAQTVGQSNHYIIILKHSSNF